MNKLIKLQLRNVFHNKLFYVCLILTIIISPLFSFISELTMKNSPVTQVFPGITSFLSSEIGIAGTIFVAMFSCFDFNEGTTKNIVARGYSRRQLLASKYIVSLIGIFLMYLIIVALYFVLFVRNGLGYNENTIILFTNSIFEISAYVIFFATISVLLEKNGSAIIACLFVPNIASLLLGLADNNLKLGISKYWLYNISGPFINNPTLSSLGLNIIYYLIYIGLFVIIGNQLLKNKEIK